MLEQFFNGTNHFNNIILNAYLGLEYIIYDKMLQKIFVSFNMIFHIIIKFFKNRIQQN